MRKLTRKLILLVAMVLAVSALTLPSSKVEAAPADCDFLSALCRLTAEVNYNLCIMKGGSVTDCAWAEAEERIRCIASVGCGPLPKPPPDN